MSDPIKLSADDVTARLALAEDVIHKLRADLRASEATRALRNAAIQAFEAAEDRRGSVPDHLSRDEIEEDCEDWDDVMDDPGASFDRYRSF